MTTQAPPKPKTPPPARKPDNGTAPRQRREFKVKNGIANHAEKVVIYGPGGIGKSSLAAAIKQIGLNTLFLDVGKGSHKLDVSRLDDLDEWDDLLAALHDDGLCSQYDAIVVDDLTTAEELAIRWTLENVHHEKGHLVTSIEGYGFGKGYMHVYETFLKLLQSLDAHIRAGRHVICIAHDCTATVPNPSGEDWIRFEPRLQSLSSGKASIRHRVREWCDHLIYIGYDLYVSDDGKGQGSGTRTIYPIELPTHMAKSRSLADEIVYEKDDAEFWKQLIS